MRSFGVFDIFGVMIYYSIPVGPTDSPSSASMYSQKKQRTYQSGHDKRVRNAGAALAKAALDRKQKPLNLRLPSLANTSTNYTADSEAQPKAEQGESLPRAPLPPLPPNAASVVLVKELQRTTASAIGIGPGVDDDDIGVIDKTETQTVPEQTVQSIDVDLDDGVHAVGGVMHDGSQHIAVNRWNFKSRKRKSQMWR